MADRVGPPTYICQHLAKTNDLSPEGLDVILKDKNLSRLKREALIEIITSLFIQAVGFEQIKLVADKDLFPLKDHSRFYPEFLAQMNKITLVVESVKKKQNPLKCPKLHTTLKGGRFECSTEDARVKKWTDRGIQAMSKPLYFMRQEPTSPEVIIYAERYEKKVLELAAFLYDQLSDHPKFYCYRSFSLINLYHAIALISSNGPITWGNLVQLYSEYVYDQNNRAEALLEDYPFSNLKILLKNPCPKPHRPCPPCQPFQEFVVNMTLDTLEDFLSSSLTHSTAERFRGIFREDEGFRRNFSLFMSDPSASLVDLNENPFYTEEQMVICQAYRMMFNLVKFHIPSSESEVSHGELLFEWALASNRTNVMKIDQSYYSEPCPPTICSPKKFIPMVVSLGQLYEKNGESFKAHAFSHLMLLITIPDRQDQFIEFLLKCNQFAPMAITTYQLQQYSHFNESLETESDLEYLEGLTKVVPNNLKGSSSAGFNLFLMRTELSVPQRLEMIGILNAGLRTEDEQQIDPTLYFIAAHHFLSGRITEHHLKIFNLYSDEYPHMSVDQKLDLLIRATAEKGEPRFTYTDRGEIDKEKTDPLALFKTLKLLDPKKEEMFAHVVALFEKNVLNQKKIDPLTEKSIRTHFLSSIPSPPTQEHVEYVIAKLRYLGHDFTEADFLRVFYEFLSLEAHHDQIHFLVEFVKLLESFTSTMQKMSPHVVADFLAYHPHLTLEQKEDLERYYEQVRKQRDALFSPEILKAPLLSKETVETVMENAAEIQGILEDKIRGNHLHREGTTWLQVTAPLLNYIYFSCIPHSIRYVTCILPTLDAARGSPNQALMPLDLNLELGKQFYASWEQEEGGYVLRYSVLTKDEKVTFSGRASFPLNPSIFEGNEALPLLLKTFVFHLGYDGGVQKDRHDLTTQKGFLSHPSIDEAWKGFSPTVGSKEEIGLALHTLCTELRIGLRNIFLNLATNRKYSDAHRSSERMDFLYLTKVAAFGDVISKGNDHVIVPYELVEGSATELSCFGTRLEVQGLYAHVDDVLKKKNISKEYPNSLNIQINSSHGLLPLKIEGKKQEINYDDREYKTLEGEPDSYQTDGYALILSTEAGKTPVSVRVIYTPYDLHSEKAFRIALSWQIAQLKSEVYRRILKVSSIKT